MTQAEYEAHLAKSGSRSSKPQQVVFNAPLAASEVPAVSPRLRNISVVSFRRRLIDPDNLIVKYHVDGLRYCGIIQDDSAAHITIQVSQEKVSRKEDECTLISIT